MGFDTTPALTTSADTKLFVPILYIIMVEDLYQMNPGKGMAQASHATSMFERSVANEERVTIGQTAIVEQARIWREDREFGTTIVLSATTPICDEIYNEAKVIGHHYFGKVIDPTYPFFNDAGKMFTRSEFTCMYVFADQHISDSLLEKLKALSLHK